MSQHGKKMIAPVVITIVFILYLLIYLVMLVREAVMEPLVILMGIPLVLLGIGSVYTLYSRIKEIRSGEEDDLLKQSMEKNSKCSAWSRAARYRL